MKKKAALIIAMALALSFMVAGCSKSSLDGSLTVATMDDKNINLGEFNLLLRYRQAQMETYYGGILGTNLYQQDLSGDGKIYGEIAKEALVEEFERMYILEAEAPNYGVELTEEEKTAAADAASKFLADNTEGAKKALGADQAAVEHLLTLLTLDDKMYGALTADVDTEVSDEEAAQKKISYVSVSMLGSEMDEDGNYIDLTDEEKAEKKAKLQSVLDAAKESGDLRAAAEAEELTASSVTYGAEGDSPATASTYLAEEVRKAADALEDGEFAELIETESALYAVQMISTFDREATDNRKEVIVSERKAELFNEKYEKLREAHTFAPADEVLAKLTFERPYVLKIEE